MIKQIKEWFHCLSINTPEKAYEYAWINGPSDLTRIMASSSPSYAYLYARNIDGKYTHETMKGTKVDDALHALYCDRFVY